SSRNTLDSVDLETPACDATSRIVGCRRSVRTVRLTGLERYRISVELPAMVGVGGHQPAAGRAGHHVQVVKVVARACRHGVIATRYEHDVAIADLDRLVERPVVRVHELHGEPLWPRRPVVVRLLEI